MTIRPFTIEVPQPRLDAITQRVGAFDWRGLADAGGWKYGVGLTDLKRLVAYWQEHYDWRAVERTLNLQPHFLAEIDGQELHFIHVAGRGSAAGRRLPVLLIHGWPGSFLEFEKLIGPLVDDGHDVVVPSLPGYAFSGRPAIPTGPRRTAMLFDGLMRQLFGESRFLIQGGDWGAAVGAWLGHDFPDRCAGLHVNMMFLQALDAKPDTEEERKWHSQREAAMAEEMGYGIEQGTRPQTLSVALSDSPVGVAGWILEKFGAWSDLARDSEGNPNIWAVYDEERLLNNIMLYLITNSIVTSTWFYRGNVLENSRWFAPGGRVSVPTGVAAFRDPVFVPPPRSFAEKSYNIVHWTQMPSGGHFAALEQPELLLGDVRRFFKIIEEA